MDHPPHAPIPRVLAATLLAVALLAALAGCGHQREGSSIEPIPPARNVNNPELGPPAVDPLSYGPGEKSSPSWGPSGERIAYIVDGYVVDKTRVPESSRRRTTRGLGAERLAWPASGGELAILGEGAPSDMILGEDKDTHPLYVTRSDEGQLKIERVAQDALAMGSPSGDAPLAAALESGAYESRISIVEPESGEVETYPEPVEGRVEEISASPDGRRALAAVLAPAGDGQERYEIHAFDLSSGESERVVRLAEGMEVLGAPQQTSDGIYYIAGKRESAEGQAEGGDVRYGLYRIPAGSAAPEPASGVGRDFIASGLKVSPGGGRLALLGRRDSGSATNLYILDLSDGSLSSATVNENMDIRTGADSLDWKNDGSSVAIVARSDVSAPRVYSGSADTLLADFYNVYEIPVDELGERG